MQWLLVGRRRIEKDFKRGEEEMPTTTYVANIGVSWQSVGGQLLASGVLLLCGYQDRELRARMGAVFWFSMAIAFSISALVTAIQGNFSYASAICGVVLCFEVLVILRWWTKRSSP